MDKLLGTWAVTSQTFLRNRPGLELTVDAQISAIEQDFFQMSQ